MRKITAGITILVSALALTACGHSDTQKTSNPQKTNPSMQISQTLTQKEISQLVQKAAKASTDSGKSVLTVTTKTKAKDKSKNNKAKTSKQKIITKFSGPTDTMYRKLDDKGQVTYLWGKGNNIYVNNTGKWLSGVSKKNNGHVGVKSAQESLKSTILSFNNKSIIGNVISKRTTGTGANGMVSLSYDLTMYQKKVLTHVKASMLVNERTGDVTKLSLMRSTPSVTINAKFTDIDELNDLAIPKKVTENAIKAENIE